MRIRLVAVDLDDTLLDSGLKISPECRQSLTEVRKMGVHITLATGRMFCSARPYALELEMDVPLITYQGALVKNAVSEEVLYFCPVPCDLGYRAAREVREKGFHYQTYYDDRLYMERLTPEGEAYARLAGVEPVIEPALLDLIKTREPTKIVIINNDAGRLRQLQAYLTGKLGPVAHITLSKPNFLEVMNPEATKGKALQKVAEYLGIDRSEVMAIGDSYNDLDMLTWAGIGVAVGNAHEEVKAAADFVTASNDEHGVAEALHRFIIKRS